MMEYIVNGNKYSLSYKELKGRYDRFCEISDDEFISELHNVLHLAAIICWLKDIPTEYSLGDEGIVHELIHLLTETNERSLEDIRNDFKMILKLA